MKKHLIIESYRISNLEEISYKRLSLKASKLIPHLFFTVTIKDDIYMTPDTLFEDALGFMKIIDRSSSVIYITFARNSVPVFLRNLDLCFLNSKYRFFNHMDGGWLPTVPDFLEKLSTVSFDDAFIDLQ